MAQPQLQSGRMTRFDCLEERPKTFLFSQILSIKLVEQIEIQNLWMLLVMKLSLNQLVFYLFLE